MRHHTVDSIERETQEILRRSGALSIPVDLSRVASALQVKIHHETMEDQVSGVLIVKGGERHILVNKSHHQNRQRFSIGHEIGHLVLHDDSSTTGEKIFIDEQIRVYQRVGEASSDVYKQQGSMTTPTMEWQANMFAAALLMPAPLVQTAALELNLWDELDIDELAKAFDVSAQAMSIRLQQLNVVELAFKPKHSHAIAENPI